MIKLIKFTVSFLVVGGWFAGLIISFNFSSLSGHPWFIYYLIATFVLWVSLKFAYYEGNK